MKRTFIDGIDVDECETFFESARGLIARPKPVAGRGMLIPRCNAIHTFFMRYPIDATFYDQNRQVVKRIRNISPWRFFIWGGWGAKMVLETAH